MKHVYDVEYDVYMKDTRSKDGYWEWNEKITVVANGSIEKALRKAVRVVLAKKGKPERDPKLKKKHGFVT